jgi:hypothetical protein
MEPAGGGFLRRAFAAIFDGGRQLAFFLVYRSIYYNPEKELYINRRAYFISAGGFVLSGVCA